MVTHIFKYTAKSYTFNHRFRSIDDSNLILFFLNQAKTKKKKTFSQTKKNGEVQYKNALIVVFSGMFGTFLCHIQCVTAPNIK